MTDREQSLINHMEIPEYTEDMDSACDKMNIEGKEGKENSTQLETVDQENDVQVQVQPEGRCAIMKDREKLQRFLHSHRFQVVIICLVAIDFLIVLVQLLMDIQVIKGVHHDHAAITALHYLSIGILGLFLVEIMVKIYAFRYKFFHHRLEVFDAIVVIISFALDVSYSGNADAWDAVGLLVLLRLWRIVRIANGIILSVKIEMDEKISHLKDEMSTLEEELQHYKNKCKEQEGLITGLEAKLKT